MTTATNDSIDLIELNKEFIYVKKNKTFFIKFIQLTQFLSWPFIFVFFNSFLKIKVTGRENFKMVNKPFLIVANHISFYDSFLFRLALGFFTPHLPLRFMAVDKFDWKVLNLLAKLRIIKFIYSLFGVFTIVEGQGISVGIQEARHIISESGIVVMYPEGKISTNEIGTFKNGSAVLAQITDVPVIPVSLKLGKNLLFRRELFINVGNPLLYLSNMPVEEVTGKFRKTILELNAKN